ncbi:efflux transporter outer membrane subunit [Duganella sp. SAP-35]|uniref:Efflux transporter outer membrane subunit n=2 Tax=Duganella aceris TaxID=2703883 RepID=A0ABX0FP88_9BURK|nr:efflux transporter outer membrane subunit [Duganella aceris]
MAATRPAKTACALAAIALCLLAGCAGRAGPPPMSALTLPEQWRTAAPLSLAGIGRAVDQEWWQAFGDPVLSELVTQALTRNADLLTARARVLESHARVTQAHAGQLPSLSASVSPQRARAMNAFNTPIDITVLAAQVEASYEVDLWGRLAALTDVALAAERAEQANADAVGLAVAATTASAYLNLRGLDAQLELTQKTLQLRRDSLDLARRGYDAGYTSQLEWLQAKAEYEAAGEAIPQLELAIAEQENTLSVLAGAAPGAVRRGLPLAALAPPDIPAGLPSALLRRRPDIYRAQQMLAAQSAALKAAQEQMLPSFRLTAAGGVQAAGWHQFINAPAELWRLAAGLSEPLFDGQRLQAQTDIAAAQRDQAFHQYENVVRNALRDTENGLTALAKLRAQAEVNLARSRTAADTLRIAQSRYRNGYNSYLEQLDAQRTQYAVEISRLQLQTRLLVASVDLYRALGGGWQRPAPPAR